MSQRIRPLIVSAFAVSAAFGCAPLEEDNVSTVSAALEEAEARRKAETEKDPDEQGGPKGPEPTRYGDWERKGLCVDF